VPEERLQKILSGAGVTSRRKAEQLILEGRVAVNGKVITELGTKADIATDYIKVDGKLIRGLERITVGKAARPELTFLLDVPATVGLARAQKRRGQGTADRFESESVEFHEDLRAAYRALAAQEPNRIVVIDGRAPREVVAERIWAAVEERLRPAPALTQAAAP